MTVLQEIARIRMAVDKETVLQIALDLTTRTLTCSPKLTPKPHAEAILDDARDQAFLSELLQLVLPFKDATQRAALVRQIQEYKGAAVVLEFTVGGKESTMHVHSK